MVKRLEVPARGLQIGGVVWIVGTAMPVVVMYSYSVVGSNPSSWWRLTYPGWQGVVWVGRLGIAWVGAILGQALSWQRVAI